MKTQEELSVNDPDEDWDDADFLDVEDDFLCVCGAGSIHDECPTPNCPNHFLDYDTSTDHR